MTKTIMRTIKFVQILFIILLIFGGIYLLFWRHPALKPALKQNQHMMSMIQNHQNYTLEIISDITAIQPGAATKIVYRIKDKKGKKLKNFEIAHEKTMHLFLIRKDVQQFQHLHPDIDQSTGKFSVNIIFPTDGPYRIFADFTPAKIEDNPQLLPITLSQDIIVGSMSNYKEQSVVSDTINKKTVGDYQVVFFASPELTVQTPINYTLTISKKGDPVRDLEPYLGALGHSVIFNTKTLDLIHTHAEFGNNGSGPDINFSTLFPHAGQYKIFTQFQHQGKALTTDFVMVVAPHTHQSTRN